jgi:hypothetical protein
MGSNLFPRTLARVVGRTSKAIGLLGVLGVFGTSFAYANPGDHRTSYGNGHYYGPHNRPYYGPVYRPRVVVPQYTRPVVVVAPPNYVSPPPYVRYVVGPRPVSYVAAPAPVVVYVAPRHGHRANWKRDEHRRNHQEWRAPVHFYGAGHY